MVRIELLQTHASNKLKEFIKEANRNIRQTISAEIKEERKEFSAAMRAKRKIEKEKRIIQIPKGSKKDDLIKIIMDNKKHFKDIIKDKKIIIKKDKQSSKSKDDKKIIIKKDKKEEVKSVPKEKSKYIKKYEAALATPIATKPKAKLGESGIGKKRKREEKPIKKKVVDVPAKESVAGKLAKSLFKEKAKPKPKPKIPTITITEEEKPKRKVIKVGGRFITPKPKAEPKSTLPPIPKSKIKIRLPKEKSKSIGDLLKENNLTFARYNREARLVYDKETNKNALNVLEFKLSSNKRDLIVAYLTPEKEKKKRIISLKTIGEKNIKKTKAEVAAELKKQQTITYKGSGGAAAATAQPVKNIDEEINSVVKVYNEIKKGGVKTPIFQGQPWIVKYIFKMILEKHKNDCIYDNVEPFFIGLLQNETKENEQILKKKEQYKKYLTPKKAPKGKTYNGGFTINFIFFSGLNRMLNKYIECKKNKKILCIPLTIGDNGGHLNMLVFNYNTQMLERYEPHGEKVKNTAYDDDYYNEVIKKIVLFFNDNGEKMRYFPPDLTCPLIKNQNKELKFAGFQQIEGKTKKYTDEKNNLYNNIVFKEGGYCSMWSLWIMDLRLQFPTVPPRKLYTTALNSLNTSESGLYDFIRGFTNSFVVNLNKKLKDYDEIMIKKRTKDEKFTPEEAKVLSRRVDSLFQKNKEDFVKTEFVISKPIFKEDTIESLTKAIEYHSKQGNDSIVEKLRNDLKKLKGKAKAKPEPESESEEDEPDEIPYKDFKLIEGVPKNIKRIFYDYVDDRTGYASPYNQREEIEELERIEKNYIKAEATRKDKSMSSAKQFKAVQTIGSILVEVRNDINNNSDLKKIYKIWTPIILKRVLDQKKKDEADLKKEEKEIAKQQKEDEKALKKAEAADKKKSK